MENFKQYFRNKKITVMGLGLLGRGIGIVKFLSKLGAKLLVTDLKTKKQLKFSLKKLKNCKSVKYVLGRHRLEDFKNKDLIIKAAGVPLNSEFINEAKKNKIPVEMDASLFAKFSKAKIIGVTGTRGKSTVAQIIYQALKKFYKKGNVFLGGNIKGLATLPLLKKAKENDLVVLELDSWQLQGFGESNISPCIAVFTTFMRDHMDYYRDNMEGYFNDKANIFKYQDKNDFLIASQQSVKEIKKRFRQKIKSRIIIADISKIKNYKTNLLGKHNKINIALASDVLRILGIEEWQIKKGIKLYKGEPGRLELILKRDGITYYNDTNATTPDATIAALKALDNNKKNIILIGGGSNKGLDFREMVKTFQKTVKALILFKGTATEEILNLLPKNFNSFEVADNMKTAIRKARKFSKEGDIFLLSPGAASFGVFKNEYDRGDQFVKYVRQS